MAKTKRVPGGRDKQAFAINEIKVAGFKSISDEQTIEIRPLTILAGTNSSGKSSMMQPLLLLKQTLEAPYDAGPIRMDGPNVSFTSAEQLLARTGKRHSSDIFQVGVRIATGDSFSVTFRKEHKTAFRIDQMDVAGAFGEFSFDERMTHADIVKTGITKGLDLAKLSPRGYGEGKLRVVRDRCLIGPVWEATNSDGANFLHGLRPGPRWEEIIPQVIHLPGLRGNPERSWPVTAPGPPFQGTFEKYTAGVILRWMEEDPDNLEALNTYLSFLKLTGGVTAKRLYDVQVELHVGRLPDMLPIRPENQVNIADVGLGVSQTLPVLVALRAAKSGMLVFVEQPEIHLHPQAQFALGRVLASAANRGVRVVVETHSSILLLAVQTLVAENTIKSQNVKLHWFTREQDGRTTVQSGDLDEAGRFGDWPEDFDNVTLEVQKRYLDAADKRLLTQ